MKISLIIPTHNRASSLRNAMDSIVKLRDEADMEIVVVDNNSTDGTREVVQSYGGIAQYVFEKRTAFTRARRTGAENAKGEILVYIDDDIIVNPGSLAEMAAVFGKYPDCGVIAGKIMAVFTEAPPAWTLDCQRSFNGWSLYNEGTFDFLKDGLQMVHSAAGPMMAIRRSTYDKVDGFPPDTIGVETNQSPKSFNKLYIGPGDGGLCIKARNAGFNIYYSPAISAYHVIPSVRFTIDFWRSRMIGEGYYLAIADRAFHKRSGRDLMLKRWRYGLFYEQSRNSVLNRIRRQACGSGMHPDEIWLHFYKAYLDMDIVLNKYPKLWRFLWKLGYDGVEDANYDEVIDALPNEYRSLVSNQFVYNSMPLNSESSFEDMMDKRGYYKVKQTGLRKVEVMLFPPREFWDRLKNQLRKMIPWLMVFCKSNFIFFIWTVLIRNAF